ncbi:MAG: tetraacyldisaccharide 4'-kinase [Simkania sp.]|nr:tetraacyldisaccharide 4'-kinase [Simkania sp.]
MSFEMIWQKQISKKTPSLLFALLSVFYRCALKFRHRAYDRGWITPHKVSACVVSIGNIACGGTGKTPIVQMVAKELSLRCKVAILSRGYRGGAEHFEEPLAVSQGAGMTADVHLAGDEAYLHASSLPGVAVWVSKHRLQSAKKAIAKGAEVVLLDDGMQHRALHRDVEVVVLDGQDNLLEQRLLPSGRLRDLPERLAVANYIIIHHAPEDLTHIAKQLSLYTAAPLIATRMSPSAKCKEIISGRKIAYFCAIGRPERFRATLRSLSVDLIEGLEEKDHALLDEKKLQGFAKISKEKGAELLVCTRKDFVKLPNYLSLPLPLFALDAEAEVIAGHDAWDALMNTIISKLQKRENLP